MYINWFIVICTRWINRTAGFLGHHLFVMLWGHQMRMEGRKWFFFYWRSTLTTQYCGILGCLWLSIRLRSQQEFLSSCWDSLFTKVKNARSWQINSGKEKKKWLARLRQWRMESHTVSRMSHESYGSCESYGTDTSTDHLVKLTICVFVYETAVINYLIINIYSVTWTLVCFFVLVEFVPLWLNSNASFMGCTHSGIFCWSRHADLFSDLKDELSDRALTVRVSLGDQEISPCLSHCLTRGEDGVEARQNKKLWRWRGLVEFPELPRI